MPNDSHLPKMEVAEFSFATTLFLLSLFGVNSLNFGDTCRTPDKAYGTCIRIRNCPYLFDALQSKPIPESTIITLKKSVCGMKEGKPLICCSSDLTSLSTTTIQPPTPDRVDHIVKLGENCKTLSGEDGTCISIRDCPFWSNYLQTISTRATTLEVLQRSLCGINGIESIFCCPAEHKNTYLLDQSNCGSVTNSSILDDNGNKTELFDVPWMALIAYNKSRGTPFRCAGSIINKRYILTAAHCVTNFSGSNIIPTSVRLGEYNLDTEIDCENSTCAPPPQNINIEKIIPHPQYIRKGNYAFDIALIRLSKDADLSTYAVRPACLPIGLISPTKDFGGKKLVTSGWHIIRVGITPSLLKNIIKGASYDKCAKIYEEKLHISPESQICAGTMEDEDCLSIGGSPLVYYEAVKDKSVPIQYGITSFGPSTCVNVVYPTVYTNVNYYMKWILDNLEA